MKPINKEVYMNTRNSHMPAIFITGIAGFIGSLIAASLKLQGFPVFGVDNMSTGYQENLPLFAKGKNWWELELATRTNIAQLAKYMRVAKEAGNGQLIIVHTAAPAYDANSHLLMGLVTEGVSVGTVTTVAAAIRAGATRFINFSSMARYEPVNMDLHKAAIGYREDDLIGGMTPYGMAKVQAEQVMMMSMERHGIPWVNIVLHNVVGMGQQYNNPARSVVAMWLNLRLHGKPIIIHGDGTQERAYSPWETIRDILLELIITPRYQGLTINVGPDPEHSMSLNELAVLVYKVAGDLTGNPLAIADDPPVYIPTDNIASMKTAVCNHDRIKMLFGSIPNPNYEETLSRMGAQMLEVEKDFDYSVFERPDLGKTALHPVYRDQKMTIKN